MRGNRAPGPVHRKPEKESSGATLALYQYNRFRRNCQGEWRKIRPTEGDRVRRKAGPSVCEKTPTGGDGEKECEKRAAGGACGNKGERGDKGRESLHTARKSSAGRWGRRCAKRPRPAAMGRRSAKKGRPGEHEGTKRRGETKGESHCTRREKVRPAGGPGSGGVAKRPRLGGEKRREKGWAIRGGGVRKKGGWGRCYVGGRRKREHYKAKDGNCNFLSLSLLL